MEKSQAIAYTFSPTGGTKKIASSILKGLGGGRLINVTSIKVDLTLNQGDIFVYCVPVFAGRVPQIAIERLKNVKSNGAFGIPVVVYGNRHYDDALLELKDAMEDSGFITLGAAAFIAQHSMAPKVAANRPDLKDSQAAISFGKDILLAKERYSPDSAPVSVPGKHPYKALSKIPVVPYTKRSCIECGVCANQCPVKAIPKDNPRLTDKEKCITCMGCISVCPKNSRKLNPFAQMAISRKLIKNCSEPKSPEIFIEI